MSTITKDQISQSYKLGKEIASENISFTDAVKKLIKKYGMNDASAKMYIRAVTSMLAGETFKRSVSIEAAEYFLEEIDKDFGKDALNRALESYASYIEYAESFLDTTKSGDRKILEKFKDGGNTMGLKDLNFLGLTAQKNYEDNYVWREISLSPEFQNKFSKGFTADGSECIMGLHTGRHIPRTGKTVDFSYQMFEIITYYTEYMKECWKYSRLVKSVLALVNDKHRAELESHATGSSNHDNTFLSVIKNEGENWKEKLASIYSEEIYKSFEEALSQEIPNDRDRQFIIQALTIEGWSHSTKTFERSEGDYAQSGCLTLMNTVKQKQGFFEDLLIFFSNEENEDILNTLLNDLKNQHEVCTASSKRTANADGLIGINQIVYGAPGAGKSYYIENITKDSESIRTVFHPEYQHSDFVGGLRPSVDGNGDISYSFVPGPFINALLKAHKNPDKHMYLIIEEINRANAAAVFGDVFQLLDRDNNGNSEYGTTPEEALKKYLDDNDYNTPDRMTIPGNLSILTTMNSSDQGVFSLDTAFKRRWQFHYCPIDFGQHKDKNSFSDAIIPYGNNLYSWTNFAEAINNELKKKDIEEDRLIGTYFLADKERINSNVCKKSISGKLLIYLWDDVLRHGLRHEIFARSYTTFSDLIRAYNDNQIIFSEKVEANLKPHAQSDDTEDQSITKVG